MCATFGIIVIANNDLAMGGAGLMDHPIHSCLLKHFTHTLSFYKLEVVWLNDDEFMCVVYTPLHM